LYEVTPITDYQLPTTDYRLPITDYRLPITDYQSTSLLVTPSLPPALTPDP